MLTIKSLREAGYKCRVNVFRYSTEHGKKLIPLFCFRIFNVQELIAAKGGKTEISIIKDNKEYKSFALCSKEDIFCRKEGLKLALDRLEKEIKL